MVAEVGSSALLEALSVEGFVLALTTFVRTRMATLKDGWARCTTLVSLGILLHRLAARDFCNVTATKLLLNFLLAC